MSIDLTLGIPRPRGPQSLVAELLGEAFSQARDVTPPNESAVSGPPIVAASGLLGQERVELGRIVVDLDVDPLHLRDAAQAGYEAVRYQLTCPSDTLDDAVALRVPAPLAVYPVLGAGDDPGLADAARVLVDGGRIPGLGTGFPTVAVADFLAVLAHADTGFVARAESAADVLSLLAGTVAALRGDDVRRALAEPDVRGLTALIPEAIAAVREVLLGIEVPGVDAVGRELAELGLHRIG